MNWTVKQIDPQSEQLSATARFSVEKMRALGVDETSLIVLLAEREGLAGATLVATAIDSLYKAEIEYLALAQDCRDPKALSALLGTAELCLRTRSVVLALFCFEKTRSDLDLLLAALKEHNWTTPTLLLRSYFVNIAAFNPPWLTRKRFLPAGHVLFDWGELSSQELRQIEAQAEQGGYSYDVFPYGISGIPEPSCSVGLRFSGKVIGWMATHKVAEDTLSYTAFYLHPKWRGRSLSLVMLAESIRRQKSSSLPIATFTLNLGRISEQWYSFVKRDIAPCAYEIRDTLTSQKTIKPAEDQKEAL